MRFAIFCIAAFAPLTAFAVDGVVLINQANALAGNVTPGDTPGFPVTISQSGSYKLSSNLVMSDPNTTVISIGADDVTIDLNGFSIIGPNVCNGAGNTPTTSCSLSSLGNGIDGFTHSRITVLNGAVRGIPFEGIVLGSDARVEGVHVYSWSLGIQANGVFVNNFAGYNMVGFEITGVARGNQAIGNGIGILGGSGVVTNNNLSFNGQYGFFGQGGAAALSGNFAEGNGTGGFLVVCPSSVVGNTGTITFNGSGSGCVLANNSN